MTPGQTRVLVLLGVLFGLETLLNPTFRGNLAKGATGQLAPQVFAAGALGWGVSGVALVALAAPAPRLATWVVVIFITLALLTHSQGWTGALSAANAAMAQLFGTSATGSSGSSSSASSTGK